MVGPISRVVVITLIVCLGVSARLGAAPNPNGAQTAFDVKKHGFNFENSWQGDILITVPLIGQLNVGRVSGYGLCGGMSMAAADTFLACGETPDLPPPPPEDAEQPGSGTPMRNYIYNRQMDSFRDDNASMIRQLASWIPRGIKTKLGVTGLHVLTDRSFKREIAPQLDAGRPVPLSLVRDDIGDLLPWEWDLKKLNSGFQENHQVLAIGYRLHDPPDGPRHWDVDVYDPNFPDEVHTLHYHEDFRLKTRRIKAGGGFADDYDRLDSNRQRAFRAFFATPYEAKTPPWAPKWQTHPVGLNTLVHAAGDNMTLSRTGNPSSFWFRALPNHTAAFRTPRVSGTHRLRRLAFNYEIAPLDFTFQVWLVSRDAQGQIVQKRIDDGAYILGRQKFATNRKVVLIDCEAVVKDFEIVFQKGNQLKGQAANDDWLLLGNIMLEVAPAP
jgi:hypothetical protein